MKKSVLVKKVSGNNSVKLDRTTRIAVRTWEDTVPNPKAENILTIARVETNSTMQTIDEFRYSGRCFCGTY